MVLSTDATTINSLPQCVIILILSFLPTVDVIRASLVCKDWLNLWHRVPTLNLDIVPFHSPLNYYVNTRELFIKLVDQALRIRPIGPLLKLYIRYDCGCYEDCEKLKSWIEYGNSCGVKELDVDFDTSDLNAIRSEEYHNGDLCTLYEWDDFIDYNFDFSWLTNKSLEVVKFHIGRCELPLLPPEMQPTDFASLRSITLVDLSFVYEDCHEKFARLVEKCINLEHLTISECYGWRRINISSSKLKICKIVGHPLEKMFPSLVITASCLHSLSLWHVLVENNLLEGCPNLIKVDLSSRDMCSSYYGWWCNMLRSLTWVKCLIVQNMFFAQRLLGHEKMLPPSCNFNNLSYLHLLTGYSKADVSGICLFLQDSPELKMLVVDYHYYPRNGEDGIITEDLMNEGVTLHLPRLKKVEMKNYRGTTSELFFVNLLKVHATILEKVEVFPAQIGDEYLKSFTIWTASSHEGVIGGQKLARET